MGNESTQLGDIPLWATVGVITEKWDENFPYERKFAKLQ